MHNIVNMNRFTQTIVLLLALLLLQSCDSPKLAAISPAGTILAFGDSLTAGVGVAIEHSYPAVLAELTGLNVVNAGISGETSDQGLKRLAEVLDQTQPELLILIEGGNDILRNKSFSDTKRNLADMIRQAKQRGIQVVLVGVPQKALFSDSAPFYPELAEQFELPFEDSVIADLQRCPSCKSDQIHFNEKGYRKMAEAIYDLLADEGAI